ncbi:MAG: prepilin-type N-terminal cleavage/methylation domain-containing protein [Motiliproteus sp.]
MTAPVTRQLSTSAGFTLIELVITIAVLSIALLTMAQSLKFSAEYGADTLWQTKAIELVQAYADEIQTKRFDHNSPVGGVPACGTASAANCSGVLGSESGESRGGGSNNFNDVDDYNGLNESPPLDSQGNIRSDYQGYRVEAGVSYAGNALGLASNSDAKLITITVTPSGQTPLVFNVYRGNY